MLMRCSLLDRVAWSSNDHAPPLTNLTTSRNRAVTYGRAESYNAPNFKFKHTHRCSSADTPHFLTCEEDNSLSSDPERSRFQPFVSNDLLKRRANEFVAEYRFSDPERVLEVRPLSEEGRAVDGCAELLTDTFADSMGYISAYRNFLFRQIRKYLRDHSALVPKSVILVARLSSSPGNEEADVVGAVEVSFSESTRSKNATLNPPTDRPYICNMAIEAEHRRRGYGKALLDAAEKLIVHMGENCVYLHARCKDKPAVRLYENNGYSVAGEDSFLVTLVGLDRRKLLTKKLKNP